MDRSVTKHKLHALCPYFAMFPHTFARTQILKHTNPDDLILDPFSGRGTTLLEGLLLNRNAIAIDINPLAACITYAKARTPSLADTDKALDSLQAEYRKTDAVPLREEQAELPLFFSHAFHPKTLREILFLRNRLCWRNNDLECFITSLILGSLHGEMDRSPSYFSNQMPRTISTKPNYSINYWRKHGLRPKRKDTFAILKARAEFRLQTGVPRNQGYVALADSRTATHTFASFRGLVDTVVTSPPYLDVTSYEEDQWLRLWYLGGEPRPTYGQVSKDDRHTSSDSYWQFLADVWQGIAPLLSKRAILVCRIGSRQLSLTRLGESLMTTIRSAFPYASLLYDPQISVPRKRQTDAFRPGSNGCRFEADFTISTN